MWMQHKNKKNMAFNSKYPLKDGNMGGCQSYCLQLGPYYNDGNPEKTISFETKHDVVSAGCMPSTDRESPFSKTCLLPKKLPI